MLDSTIFSGGLTNRPVSVSVAGDKDGMLVPIPFLVKDISKVRMQLNNGWIGDTQYLFNASFSFYISEQICKIHANSGAYNFDFSVQSGQLFVFPNLDLDYLPDGFFEIGITIWEER